MKSAWAMAATCAAVLWGCHPSPGPAEPPRAMSPDRPGVSELTYLATVKIDDV